MRASRKLISGSDTTSRSRGFTLIELLISITILIILATVTVTAVNLTTSRDLIPGAARDVQSFLEGARDRAIFRGKPVGVRLYLDPNGVQNGLGNSLTVNSMVYVGTPPVLTGFLDIRNRDSAGNPDYRSIVAINNDPLTIWDSIRNNRGLINRSLAMQIEIENPTTNVFSTYRMVYDNQGGDTGWKLTRPYDGTKLIGLKYKLTLLPYVLPNQTTRELPDGVVINLESSRVNGRIPSFWYSPESAANATLPSDRGNYFSYLDIMFTPSGTGVGAASGSGMIQLHIAGIQDVERATFAALSLGNPRNVEAERLVTVSPVTGNVSVAEIPLFTDADMDDVPDSAAYDPYIFAELGKTAP